MACKHGDRLKPGNESRAAINCALLTAGAAGLSCNDLAILVGLKPNGVRWHFDRMDGSVVEVKTADTRKTRAFHADYRDAAEAYLAACTIGRQRKGGPSQATRDRVLRTIELAGAAGIGMKDLMAAASLTRPTLNIIMPQLVRDERVRMSRPPGGGKGRPAHYWGWDAMPADDSSPALRVTRKPGKAPQKTLPKGDSQDRPIIVPAGVKVTICPSGTDHRFTVKHPTPFFSHMTPGSYMRTGSAIERAYGGGA